VTDPATTRRILTTRELNRALLARQLLLDRAHLPPDRALAAVCGLQTQHAPSGYLGLWSRTAGFRRSDLTAALGRAAVVQGWVMRSTIHMVAATDYAPFTAAVRAARRAQWLRAEKRAAGVDMAAVAAAVRRHLADGPLPQARLVALLAQAGFPRVAFAGAQLWVDLLRVPPAGTWDRPRANVFALAEHVLPGALPAVDEDAARDLLVTRYLAAFGPASAHDTASFTGLPLAEVRTVLARAALRRFRDEAGGDLVDVPDGPLPDAATPAPVRFLPTWDATLLVHARRTQLLPEAYRSRIFATTMPRSVPTFLVDGQVAGTWRYADGRVVSTPFHDLPAAAHRAVDAEAERLAAFHADPECAQRITAGGRSCTPP
jgi:Winged helix DNA-binding domain